MAGIHIEIRQLHHDPPASCQATECMRLQMTKTATAPQDPVLTGKTGKTRQGRRVVSASEPSLVIPSKAWKLSPPLTGRWNPFLTLRFHAPSHLYRHGMLSPHIPLLGRLPLVALRMVNSMLDRPLFLGCRTCHLGTGEAVQAATSVFVGSTTAKQ